MNKKKFLEILCLALREFLIYPELISELISHLEHSGNEKNFVNILLKRLKFLESEGVAAIQHEEFERLKQNKNIYSMHIASKKMNIRILYSFIDGKPALLLAFYEREGKKATDYTGKIELAQARLNELKQDE